MQANKAKFPSHGVWLLSQLMSEEEAAGNSSRLVNHSPGLPYREEVFYVARWRNCECISTGIIATPDEALVMSSFQRVFQKDLNFVQGRAVREIVLNNLLGSFSSLKLFQRRYSVFASFLKRGAIALFLTPVDLIVGMHVAG